MEHARRILAPGIIFTVVLAGCSAKPVPEQAEAPPPAPPVQVAKIPEPRVIPPLTMDAYKKEFAGQVARASSEHLFADPLPEMFKSIVVVEVRIDREGALQRVAVRRSNGYKALENRALDSVRRAAPFVAPAFTIRRSDGTVEFLETFLFRDDGRFQIRSLVAEK